MRTPKEWMQIHAENGFYANSTLSERDIQDMLNDALQHAANICLSNNNSGEGKVCHDAIIKELK